MMAEESPNTIQSEALKLHGDHGWFVFPAAPRVKAPYAGFRWKPYGDALVSRQELTSWPQWHSKDVRLATRTGAVSGIIVLDVDSEEAHKFIKSKRHPLCPMTRSPREGGGLHLYFSHPGFRVKNAVGFAGVEGLDLRGDGGIVVLPPSLDYESGRAYEWIISPSEVPPPPCPAWLLELLQKQSTFKEAQDASVVMAGIPKGQRDTELNRMAGWLRHKNFPQDVAEHIIEEAAERCNPPFGRAEARAKVRWAFTHYEPGENPSQASLLSRNHKPEDEDSFTAEELMEEELPPVKWIIPGLLPQGSMLLGGKPKMGKSWMALSFCIATATGGKALGEFECVSGDVLYMALEDNKRRLQSRTRELLQSESRGPGSLKRLTLKVRSRRLDSGLLEDLEEWLETRPEARLVVIDTLGSVRGTSTSSRTLYEQDYEVGSALTQLAEDYSVCILIIHHLRKGESEDYLEMISGSTGLTGGMDGAMVLNRTRSAADAILKAVHRDVEEDPEMALQKVGASEGWWKYAGDAEEYMMGKERREILDVLANADEAMKPAEIADMLGKPAKNVSELLRKMLESGHVDSRGYGKYVVSLSLPALHTDGSGGSGGSSTNGLGSTGSNNSGGSKNPPFAGTSTTSTTSTDGSGI